jgi:hypothetical protein
VGRAGARAFVKGGFMMWSRGFAFLGSDVALGDDAHVGGMAVELVPLGAGILGIS